MVSKYTATRGLAYSYTIREETHF